MAEPDEYELTEDELNDWESAYTPRAHFLSQNCMDFSRCSDHFSAHENTIDRTPRNSLNVPDDSVSNVFWSPSTPLFPKTPKPSMFKGQKISNLKCGV